MSAEAAPRVGLVVLAAGGSRRLGRPKQLLDLGGKPLLQRTLDNALASKAAAVVVVLGAQAEAIERAITPGRARIVRNVDWAAGQSTSLRAGLDALDPTLDAALFMLGDQPLIGPAALDALIDAFGATRAPLVIPTYDGVPGNPVLFARALWRELRRVAGDRGAREVVRAHAAEATRVAIRDGSRPDDVDDEGAYRRVVEAWSSRG